MDSMRNLNTSLPPGANAPKPAAQNESSPEQLLDAFKAAALSVTKLYKTSAASQAKARSEGYQDCLDDLLTFLDKENIGVDDGEGWRIRQWATERYETRETFSHESEDEVEKPETTSSPEPTQRANTTHQQSTSSSAPRAESNLSKVESAPELPEPAPIAVPSQDTFTFQSSHPYPPHPPSDSYMNLANLDLSDTLSAPPTGPSSNNNSSTRNKSQKSRSGGRQSGQLGRGAGSKRKINFAEIFDLGSLGSDKNMFGGGGPGGKRSRHA